MFPPAKEFSSRANIKSSEEYESIRKRAEKDPEGFWAEVASELHWFEKWNKVLEWNLPFSKWFVGGKTNVSYNCLDRHLTTSRKNKVAILWEGEPGDVRALSYQMLHREVCRFANVLKSLGIQKGDRATIYMGMVPELAIAMLACARIGITHNVVFGGFSAEALRDRINDSQSRVLITADGGYRRGTIVPLKKNCRRRAARFAVDRKCHCLQTHGRRHPDGVQGAMCGGTNLMAVASDRCPAEAAGFRTSAVHALHQRNDRQTERCRAHDRRIHDRHVHHNEVGFRPEGRRHLLVHGRHRLGHRTQLYCLRSAAERRNVPHVRRRAELSRARSVLVDHRKISRSTFSIRRRQRSAPSPSGATSGRRSTTCRACVCWAPSANRSIPKRGCGTANTSVATAVRSWTRGGRPKPAR